MKFSLVLSIGLASIFTGCKPSGNNENNINDIGDKTIVSNAINKAEWVFTSTLHFNIYALENSITAKNLKSSVETLETARIKVLNKLKEKSSGPKPTVFYVEEREQMQKLVGSPAGGWTEVGENAIFLAQNVKGAAPVLHELGHLYSWKNWNKPKAYWLSEGVAVFAVGECAGISLHAWAAGLAREGNLVSMEKLEREEFDFSRAAPHLQAGSFIQFIVEDYGIEALKLLWERGLSGAVEATGITASELEQLWLQLIAQKEFVELGKELTTQGKIKCE